MSAKSYKGAAFSNQSIDIGEVEMRPCGNWCPGAYRDGKEWWNAPRRDEIL